VRGVPNTADETLLRSGNWCPIGTLMDHFAASMFPGCTKTSDVSFAILINLLSYLTLYAGCFQKEGVWI
jgi:hypothetical protein